MGRNNGPSHFSDKSTAIEPRCTFAPFIGSGISVCVKSALHLLFVNRASAVVMPPAADCRVKVRNFGSTRGRSVVWNCA